MKRFPHWAQQNGLSPVCTLMCVSSPRADEKYLPQYVQPNRRSLPNRFRSSWDALRPMKGKAFRSLSGLEAEGTEHGLCSVRVLRGAVSFVGLGLREGAGLKVKGLWAGSGVRETAVSVFTALPVW